MKKILLLIAALALGISSGCGKEDTPEDAMREIQTAIANQDRQALESRVDVDKFLNDLYSDITEQIADNIPKLHESYPDDPYFWNTPQFIRKYNEEHRIFYMSFVNAAVNAYFDPNVKPDNFLNTFSIQCANEFKNICNAIDTKTSKAAINGDQATIDFELQGDESLHGKFIGNLKFKFVFEKDDQSRWKLTKIDNLDELLMPIVDKAEIVWPETIMNK